MSQPRLLEFEKRFCLSDQQIEKLKALGEYSKEAITNDELWDTQNFDLTKTDRCLRRRNGQWELKVPLPQDTKIMSCREEITDTKTIAQVLDLKGNTENLEEALGKSGIVYHGTAVGERSYYKRGNMTFDFAEFTFEGTAVSLEPYRNIVEIEVVLSSEEQEDPTDQIKAFANEHGLPWERVKGKFPYMIKAIKAARKLG